MHETECASLADIVDKERAGELQFSMRRAVAKNGLVKVDGKRHFEAIKGEKAGYLVAVFHRDLAFYANELLRRLLLLYPG